MKYLGIDVGGTNIAVGIVDENDKIIAKVSNKTPVPCTEDEFCDCVAKTAFQAMEKAGVTLEEFEANRDEIVHRALADACTQANPRKVTADDVNRILDHIAK